MDIKVLREEFAQLHTEANAYLQTKVTEKGGFSAEEKEQQDRRFARMDEIKDQLKQYEKLADDAILQTKNGEFTGMVSKSHAVAVRNLSEREQANEFGRTGKVRDNFTIISTSQNSIALPVEVLGPTIVRRNQNAFRAALAKTGYSALSNPNVVQFNMPVWDDTAYTGESISEALTTDDTQDTDLSGSITLGVTLFEGKTRWFSNTTVLAGTFDPLQTAGVVLHQMVEKARESAGTTQAKTLTKNLFTSATSAVFAYADLIAWEHTLPVAYRSDSVFILSDSLYKTMRGLVDNNGRPVIDLDPTNNWSEVIHGKPIVVSDYFDAVSASSKSGMYCSGAAIMVYDAGPLRFIRFENYPLKVDQVGYNLAQNGDIQFMAAGCSLCKIHA